MISLHFLLLLIASKESSSFRSLQRFALCYKLEIVRCDYFYDLFGLVTSSANLESFNDCVLVTDQASFLAFEFSMVREAFRLAVII